jgi:REP element-mobilizing transposase RayT
VVASLTAMGRPSPLVRRAQPKCDRSENDQCRIKMARRTPKQLELPTAHRWGGARPGAGRKPAPHSGPTHEPRPPHDRRYPVHVTLRARRDVPSLRAHPTFVSLQRAIGRATRLSFRVIHFSVQTDHLHLIVEAESSETLRRGLQGLAGRCARAINRASNHRGRVWRHRYHAHTLQTPSEVRRAIAYVLLNFRKHLRAEAGVDPRSSGQWFDGWAEAPLSSVWPRLVALPRTWLASAGWRRAGGPIATDEGPSRS